MGPVMRVSTIVEYIRVVKIIDLERYLYCQQRTHLIYICILHNVPEVNIFTRMYVTHNRPVFHINTSLPLPIVGPQFSDPRKPGKN